MINPDSPITTEGLTQLISDLYAVYWKAQDADRAAEHSVFITPMDAAGRDELISNHARIRSARRDIKHALDEITLVEFHQKNIFKFNKKNSKIN